MRPDFKKLLCERRRMSIHDHGEVYNQTRESQRETHLDYDEHEPGKKISIKKTFRGKGTKTKSLNEYLQPLYGFLRANAGRPWNDVYSEIAEVCPKDSAVNAHVYQHLFHNVEVNPVYRVDGVHQAEHKHYRFDEPLMSTKRFPRFYVNEEGLLIEAPKAKSQKELDNELKQKRATYEKDLGWSDKKKCYIWAIKLGGKWFEAKLKDIPNHYAIMHSTTMDSFLSFKLPKPIKDLYLMSLPEKERPYPYNLVKDQVEHFKTREDWRLRCLAHKKYYGKPIYVYEFREFTISERQKHNLRNKVV